MIQELADLLQTRDVDRIVRWARHFSRRSFETDTALAGEQAQHLRDFDYCTDRLQAIGAFEAMRLVRKEHQTRRFLKSVETKLDQHITRYEREAEDGNGFPAFRD